MEDATERFRLECRREHDLVMDRMLADEFPEDDEPTVLHWPSEPIPIDMNRARKARNRK